MPESLRPFQRQFVRAVRDPRINRAVLSVPRGNGKSWLSGLLVASSLSPGEALHAPGVENVLLSGSLDQARFVYRFAKQFLEATGVPGYSFQDSRQQMGITHVGERAVEGLQGAPVSEVEVAPDPRRLWRAGDDWVRPRLRAGALDVGLPEVAEGPRRSRRSRCRPLDPPPARDVAGIVREQPELPGRTDHLVVDGSNDSLGRRIHGREGVDDRHARTVAVVQRVTDPGLGQVQQERARGGFKSHRRHSSTSRERDLILAAQSLEVDLDTRSRPSCIALVLPSARN